MTSSQFQLEAVEIECSRLLAMEDQIASVITLLQRAKDVVGNPVNSHIQELLINTEGIWVRIIPQTATQMFSPPYLNIVVTS